MDVEKTVQFLLEQQTVFTSQMGELHTIVHDMAVNQVALGKAQARFDANMRELQSHLERSAQRMDRIEQNMERFDQRMERLDQNMERLDEKQERTEAMVQALVGQVDRLVKTLDGRFGANGSAA